MFKNLKLRNQILLGYVPPIVLLVVSALLVYQSARTATYHSNQVDSAYRIVLGLKSLEASGSQIERAARGYYLVKDESYLKTIADGEEDFKKLAATLNEQIGTIVKDEKNKMLLDKIVESGNKVTSYLQGLIAIMKEGKQAKAIEEFRTGEATKLYREFNALINELEDRENQVLAESLKAEDEALKFLVRTIILGTLIASLIAVAIGFWIATNISRSINETASSLSATSTEIASTVEQHERSATEQAASVNETTTTMEELGTSSRQSAEQADAVAAMAKQALATTEEGVKIARQASDGMSKTKEKVGAIGEQILHLSEQTGQIGGIAAVVTDIAGQINMLALNAAVEAVRAGEQGKGFAVIAQEVRKLADQGKKSAERVNTIVIDIQKATNSAVMVTEEGTKTVQEVADLAGKAGEAFSSLSGVANSVYENAQQVSLNAKQQVTAIKQVGDAMNQINAGAKDTAAGISQTKVGIQRLNESAQNLKKMV